MLFESLERRELLSVTAKFDEASSTYFVKGTERSDEIRVTIEATAGAFEKSRGSASTARAAGAVDEAPQLSFASALDGGTGRVRQPQFETISVWQGRTFIREEVRPLGTVKVLSVTGLGGDDAISVGNFRTPAKVVISGGAGNDVIQSASAGTRGADVFGDAGDDTLGGKGSTVGQFMAGGTGGDTVVGTDFDDVLFGDTDGDRQAEIGHGNDMIFGGRGKDLLRGGGGDDSLDGGDGADLVDGGNGKDLAAIDKSDEMLNIERLAARI